MPQRRRRTTPRWFAELAYGVNAEPLSETPDRARVRCVCVRVRVCVWPAHDDGAGSAAARGRVAGPAGAGRERHHTRPVQALCVGTERESDPALHLARERRLGVGGSCCGHRALRRRCRAWVSVRARRDQGLRWAFALALSTVFIVLDVLLVEALPDADAALRSFVVSFSALPLGALFAVSKHALGMPANAMTDNLARDVDRVMRRLWSWRRASPDGPDPALTHEDGLAFLLPVLFTLGGVAGVEIERNLDYALSVLSPGFALGLFVADLAPSMRAPDREPAPQRLVAATTGAKRSVRFVLNL